MMNELNGTLYQWNIIGHSLYARDIIDRKQFRKCLKTYVFMGRIA